MLAYKSSSFRSATIGDEYPATLRDGELTAPKRAQSHEFFKALDKLKIVEELNRSDLHALDGLDWQCRASALKQFKTSKQFNELGFWNVGS